ncbi:MAG: endopeptidase La [Armatimonadota bacterium]
MSETEVQDEAQPPLAEEEPSAVRTYPVLPVRDTVIFPYMVAPLIVGRDRSVQALQQAKLRGRAILLITQKQADTDDPSPEELHQVGTIARSLQMLELPDGSMRVVVEGLQRARVIEFVQAEPHYEAAVEELAEVEDKTKEIEALMRSVVGQFERVVSLSRNIPPEALVTAMNIGEPGKLADLVAAYLGVGLEAKQELLETTASDQRLEKLSALLSQELEILELEKKIHSRVRDELQSSQREYYLREQMRAIQDELGEQEGLGLEAEEYKQKIKEARMSEEATEKALKEVSRLERMPAIAPEGTVIRTYLDWLISLPWDERTEDKLDIKEAEKILDEDHYGLRRVKERVVEFLAVRKLVDRVKGPILCFIGPPGVGKTSIGRSVARALGRKFIRISLGGVRDEAEIRGHRRTYIGALPGRIIQTIRTSGSKNPVFMLDEIDKIGIDFRGDPSAALLEVLDPEQNHAFSDHYLEVPFDLSEVMFIATGNLLDPVPPALKDRVEVIRFPGYVEEEKLQIARHFLVPKQLGEHGLEDGAKVRFSDGALRNICRYYTREAGVRNFEREIASICRKVAKQVASGEQPDVHVTARSLDGYLGPRRFRYGAAEEKDEVAVATGLTYTELGGDVIAIEVSLVDGKGELLLTGQLGDVMKESAQAAMSYVRSRVKELGGSPELFEKRDIHIHVPEGAVPKEGPSAGITVAVALASALSGRPVRKDVAMTGEITLRGKVLPVGGVREKVLAAHRAQIGRVIMPRENQKDLKDLEEIPSDVRKKVKFTFVEHMDEVLKAALV